jgi:hypothetical protein
MACNRRLPFLACVVLALPLAQGALAQGRACTLVTPGEVEAALGFKPAFTPKTMSGGVELCNSTAGPEWVLIRLFTRTPDKPAMSEQDEIDMIKKAGATVEVRKHGAIRCMAIVPGGPSAGQKLSTHCTVTKPPMVAVIEVMRPNEPTAIDRLLPLAEKMMARF